MLATDIKFLLLTIDIGTYHIVITCILYLSQLLQIKYHGL